MMKNLKFKLAFIGVLFFSTTLFSQGFYLTTSGGYAFTMNGQNGLASNRSEESVYDSSGGQSMRSSTTESVSLSYGKGVDFGGSVGYMFNDYLGIDLGFNYLVGGVTKTNNNSIYTEIGPIITNVVKRSEITKNYSRMFRVIPSIVLTPNFEKINPYIKIGAVLGFGSFYAESESESFKNGSKESAYSFAYKSNGGLALGFNAGLGASYTISNKLSLFGEVSYIGMSYAPQKSVVTKWENHGTDLLPNLSTNQKEIAYVDEYTQVQNATNPDEPMKQLSFSQPFSSLGFNFGIKLNLTASK